MTEEKAGTETQAPIIGIRWENYKEKEALVFAIRYIVVEKEGKRLSNFEKIIKKAGVNGRVWQDGEVVRISDRGDRFVLRAGQWLTLNTIGELRVYSDGQFNALYRTASGEVADETDTPQDDLQNRLMEHLDKELKQISDAVSPDEIGKIFIAHFKDSMPDLDKNIEESMKTALANAGFASKKDLDAIKKQITAIRKELKNATAKPSKS